jgi:hypothetical protein
MNQAETEARVAAFTAKYTPAIAAATMACRRKVQALFPRGFELVYDNYNALVFGFGPSEKASSAVLSVAVYPKWVTLFFLHGTALQDPARLLQGAGSRVRSIRLKAPADLDLPEVRFLIDQALQSCAEELANAPSLRTVIKSVSARQRSRRPAK